MLEQIHRHLQSKEGMCSSERGPAELQQVGMLAILVGGVLKAQEANDVDPCEPTSLQQLSYFEKEKRPNALGTVEGELLAER
jgi:hypothetical protein